MFALLIFILMILLSCITKVFLVRNENFVRSLICIITLYRITTVNCELVSLEINYIIHHIFMTSILFYWNSQENIVILTVQLLIDSLYHFDPFIVCQIDISSHKINNSRNAIWNVDDCDINNFKYLQIAFCLRFLWLNWFSLRD